MTVGKIILYTIASMLILLFIVFAITGFRSATADLFGRVEQEVYTKSAPYRIFSYDHFYNLYADVQAYEDQIENQQVLLELATKEEQKYKYLQNINALRNQRDRTIRQYNADVRKEGTRGQFKANDLPTELFPKEE